jgi:hypothetical protein
MGYQLWIPDLLRDEGVEPVEVAGWQTRGRSTFNPGGSVNHHTAGPRRGNIPSLAILTFGRSDLPGPLCNVGQARDNRAYVVAAGRANHAGTGGWKGLIGNSSVLGLEVENTGSPMTEPWRPDQIDTMARIHAAFAKGAKYSAAMVCQHKEWTSRKPDAHTIHGPTFRAMVEQRMGAPAPPPVTPLPPSTVPTITGDPDMFLAVNNYGFFVIVDGVPIAFPDMQSWAHAKNNSSNVTMVWLEREQGEPLIQNLLQQMAKP